MLDIQKYSALKNLCVWFGFSYQKSPHSLYVYWSCMRDPERLLK